MIKRFLSADSLAAETCFLWGPRQIGKSTLLRSLFPSAPSYDLLSAREFGSRRGWVPTSAIIFGRK